MAARRETEGDGGGTGDRRSSCLSASPRPAPGMSHMTVPIDGWDFPWTGCSPWCLLGGGGAGAGGRGVKV